MNKREQVASLCKLHKVGNLRVAEFDRGERPLVFLVV
jgi:hypothetical protein